MKKNVYDDIAHTYDIIVWTKIHTKNIKAFFDLTINIRIIFNYIDEKNIESDSQGHDYN
jgi:hypothetical protein